jgi:hypothetical protein
MILWGIQCEERLNKHLNEYYQMPDLKKSKFLIFIQALVQASQEAKFYPYLALEL